MVYFNLIGRFSLPPQGFAKKNNIKVTPKTPENFGAYFFTFVGNFPYIPMWPTLLSPGRGGEVVTYWFFFS